MRDQEFFERVRLVFHDALAVPPDERAGFLAEVCGEDGALLTELTDLFDYEKRAHAALESPLISRFDGELLTGTRLGDYHLYETLGEGGMGVVYRARDDRSGEFVALKVLRSDLLSRTAATRFRLESHTLQRLQGEGIARLLEAGTVVHGERRLSYYAMELVEGRSLREVDIPDLRDRIALLERVCDAVGLAHARGIIHRDVKPENVLIRQDGRPVVLDFGISRTVDPDGRSTGFATSTGQVLGTVSYMSPEQLIGDGSAMGPPSDVYSLGILAYELLTGTHPHEPAGLVERSTLTQAAVILAIERQDLPLASSRCPELPPDIDAILHQALQRNAGDRYADAAAMAADFRAYLEGRKVVAPRQTFARRNWNRIRRAPKRSAVIAAVALGIVLLAGGITKTLQDRQEERLVQTKLTELWGVLQEVNQDLHLSGTRNEESIRRALTNLDRSREILRTMPRRPFWHRLRRFVDWRSGEAHYFLGTRNRDVEEFHLAFGKWSDAAAFTNNQVETLEGLDKASSLYGDIAEIVLPIVVGGRALACSAIADYEDRAEYLRLAVHWRSMAFELFESDRDWGLGSVGKKVRSMATLDYAGALIDYGIAVDSLAAVNQGFSLMQRVDDETLWMGRRNALASGQHHLGDAARYRWRRSGNLSDWAEAQRRYRRALGLRAEGTGSNLHVLDELALARLELWAGRQSSSDSSATAHLGLAREKMARIQAYRDPQRGAFSQASIDALDAEITAAWSGVDGIDTRAAEMAIARSESLLVAAEAVFTRSRFPLQNAELQLASIRVLEASEAIVGPRDDEIRAALATIESIVPGGIWPLLRRRAESHRR